jgi:hypothetical protein
MPHQKFEANQLLVSITNSPEAHEFKTTWTFFPKSADLCQQHSTKAIYTRFDFVSLDQEVVKNRIESMTMLTNSNQFQHMLVEIFLLF